MRTTLILALAACAGDSAKDTDPSDTDTANDPVPEDCQDDIDNNGDGLADCADPSCAAECPERCDDSFDNDFDTLVDCADPDCPPCPELCDAHQADEDGDGLVDCADPDCTDSCAEFCNDTIDNDADSLIDCVDDECYGVCDRDGDGFLGISYGGDDCDDNEPGAYPGGTDLCGDGIDGDCVDGDCPGSTGDTAGDTGIVGTSPADTSDTGP